MNKSKFILSLTVILVISLIGCKKQSFAVSSTIEEAVDDYYKTVYDYKDGFTTDIEVFVSYNRDEILRTLEISEIQEIKEKDLAIVFTRFSIGTSVIRQGLWFHRIANNWTKTSNNNYRYGYEKIGYQEIDDRLQELMDKKENWMENNPSTWWSEYFNW